MVHERFLRTCSKTHGCNVWENRPTNFDNLYRKTQSRQLYSSMPVVICRMLAIGPPKRNSVGVKTAEIWIHMYLTENGYKCFLGSNDTNVSCAFFSCTLLLLGYIFSYNPRFYIAWLIF